MALFDALMRKPGTAWCRVFDELSVGWGSWGVEMPKNKAHKRKLVSLESQRVLNDLLDYTDYPDTSILLRLGDEIR